METDRLLRELTDFLRIPSVSTLPAHNADCRAAAEWVAGELRRLGCREVQFLASGTHPVVWGVGPDVPGAPTLLLYGHYDVQPPDPLDEWTTPPFEPTVRDAKLFARGAADDKGQVFCLLKAIEATGRPPVNFRFLIEGEEEYGSRVLFELLRREPERTRADVVLIADMSYIAPKWPAVYTTLRGLCYAEITVRTAKSDLHSGEFGGAAPNAHEELVRLLARLKTPDGKIQVPGLYGAVRRPTKAELATWKSLPFKDGEFLKHRVQARALTGLKGHSVLERLWALPTLEIHGIMGGFTTDGAKTVIPAEGEPAARAQSEAQDGGAPAGGRRQAIRAQVRPGERQVPAWRGPRDREGHAPRLQAARSGIPRSRGSRHGAGPGGRLDSGRPGARQGRGGGDPHRHRPPRRSLACAQRETRPEAVVGRDQGLPPILRAARGEGRRGRALRR